MAHISVFFISVVLLIGISADFSEAKNKCKRLKRLDHELYGTKTIYSDARNFLAKKDDLPESFDDDSLEEEHKDLVKDHCKPVVFYFIGRHSARYPDGEDIEVYNKHLSEIQERLKDHYAENMCPEKFQAFLDWKPRMVPKQDNLITGLGGREERDIAARFKSIYPEFFDADKTDINIGVTKKVRTAQTGAEFLREVSNFKLQDCEGKALPNTEAGAPDYNLDEILSSACYKSMMDKYAKPYLEFHDECKKISRQTKDREPLVERVKDPKLIKDIIEDVSERLGFDKANSPINAETLDSIYDTCKFENAFQNDSIWCTLFEKKDAQVLEYIEDVSTYLKGAYGSSARPHQSCPLVKNLIESFIDGMKLTGSEAEKRRSYFYFSHATPMKKLLATFGVFKDNKSFSESKIRDFEEDLKVPKNREWRSSVISPFSANMAFILYRCQKPGKEAKHKVLATVTEQPVKLGGCKETHCSSEKFFDTYNTLRDCDLSRICG